MSDRDVWIKSTASGNGNCVQWSFAGDGVRVRDSKDPKGGQLHFTEAEWRAFILGVRAGEADVP